MERAFNPFTIMWVSVLGLRPRLVWNAPLVLRKNEDSKMHPEIINFLPKVDFTRRGFVVTSLATGFALAVQPVSAETITTSAEGLEAGEVKIPTKDGDMPGYRAMPVLVNEDPNFSFADPDNHLLASVGEYVSWGYYEQGQSNYQDGFQSPPVNWTINTANKTQFFELVKKVTGA